MIIFSITLNIFLKLAFSLLNSLLNLFFRKNNQIKIGSHLNKSQYMYIKGILKINEI